MVLLGTIIIMELRLASAQSAADGIQVESAASIKERKKKKKKQERQKKGILNEFCLFN